MKFWKATALLLGMLMLCSLWAQSGKSEQPSAETDQGGIVLLVNSQSGIWEQLSAKELKKIYLGKMTFRNGVRIILTSREERELRETFFQEYTGISDKSFTSYWKQKVFSEGGEVPKRIVGIEELISYITEHEGAIGFAWQAEVPEVPAGLKVILPK